jgi:hypothetical protein
MRNPFAGLFRHQPAPSTAFPTPIHVEDPENAVISHLSDHPGQTTADIAHATRLPFAATLSVLTRLQHAGTVVTYWSGPTERRVRLHRLAEPKTADTEQASDTTDAETGQTSTEPDTPDGMAERTSVNTPPMPQRGAIPKALLFPKPDAVPLGSDGRPMWTTKAHP